MSSLVESIVLALKDLIKFKIISYVNTGDKTQDNLINAFLLACVTIIFTTFSWHSIVVKIQIWKNKTGKFVPLNSTTIPYYKSLIPELIKDMYNRRI